MHSRVWSEKCSETTEKLGQSCLAQGRKWGAVRIKVVDFEEKAGHWHLKNDLKGTPWNIEVRSMNASTPGTLTFLISSLVLEASPDKLWSGVLVHLLQQKYSLGALNSKHLFLTVLEAKKSKIKMPEGLVLECTALEGKNCLFTFPQAPWRVVVPPIQFYGR